MRGSWIALALVLPACAPPPGPQPPRSAAELAGRTAGTAQRCVRIEPGESLRVADGDPAILLHGRGRSLWASRLQDGCAMRSGDILVVEPLGSQFCRGDLVRSVDPLTGIPGPGCALGDFVPYTM